MRRRSFLLLSIITFITKSFAFGKNNNPYKALNSTLEHLFPQTHRFNGASSLKSFDFFTFIFKHPTFDKEDLEFILDGANELFKREENFTSLSKEKKEIALREFEKTTFGQNWLSMILYYGLESILGDPIYKGNKNMNGWKNFNHTTPVPTAKKPFGEKL